MFNLAVKLLKSNFWFRDNNCNPNRTLAETQQICVVSSHPSACHYTLIEQATNKNAL